MRIGHGYDVHADVLVHAIMDALLGAAALGDIGKMYPDSDSKYKDASSLYLLENVINRLKSLNYRIINIDSTIIAQEPKLSSYIPYMEKNISRVCEIK